LSILSGSYVGGITTGPGHTGSSGGYQTFLGAKLAVHLPFWRNLGAIAVFSLIVFAVNSPLGPEQVNEHALEAAADAHRKDLDPGVGHPARHSIGRKAGPAPVSRAGPACTDSHTGAARINRSPSWLTPPVRRLCASAPRTNLDYRGVTAGRKPFRVAAVPGSGVVSGPAGQGWILRKSPGLYLRSKNSSAGP
jgi:hypothetical protein